ncbi:hypothetical protein ANN_23763 [Periplaneta americana]|uniref:Mos1 transposase HTH domain-containing protein n=1 Tax=Periplaneta americana TaxID=6978 RepID=A0ABQ8SNF7_PERAM|nr:hypothetical protein ANN_23763 [Periplaneta americana]
MSVTETDTLPQHMCYQCASTLIAWHDLVISCVEADKKLRELQMEENDDDDDKGGEMFESPSLDSEMTDDVIQPSTSETQNQNQVSKTPSSKKAAVAKEKKSKLKMILVKGPPAGTSGQKTASKTQVAKALELAKSKDGVSQDSASERNAYSVLVGRLKGKRPLGRPRHRWEDNIKMDLREVGYDNRKWINLAQNRDQWRAYMTERIEQRYCIKFCQKLDDSQSQTIRKIQQVFGEDAMSVTQIKEWFNRFKDGRTSAESEQRCGRPQTARSAAVVERVRNLVMADRRLTMQEIAEEVGVSKDSAHAILRDDLNMNRVAAKFVPKLLSPEQKDLRRDVAQDLLDTANTDPGFLNTVITGDESWVYGYDPETKRQSSQWKHPESPRPKKAWNCASRIRTGRTNVQRKRPDMWTANNWHLHHDNVPAHSSQLIHTFLAKHGITNVRQPPYSPDLAPCDFWLFPKLKTPLKGSRFESREEIMRNATTELNTIPKGDFQRYFRQWKDRWAKCVQAQEAYFEGD